MKFTIVLSALVAAVMAAPGAVPAELEKRCDANGVACWSNTQCCSGWCANVSPTGDVSSGNFQCTDK